MSEKRYPLGASANQLNILQKAVDNARAMKYD